MCSCGVRWDVKRLAQVPKARGPVGSRSLCRDDPCALFPSRAAQGWAWGVQTCIPASARRVTTGKSGSLSGPQGLSPTWGCVSCNVSVSPAGLGKPERGRCMRVKHVTHGDASVVPGIRYSPQCWPAWPSSPRPSALHRESPQSRSRPAPARGPGTRSAFSPHAETAQPTNSEPPRLSDGPILLPPNPTHRRVTGRWTDTLVQDFHDVY